MTTRPDLAALKKLLGGHALPWLYGPVTGMIETAQLSPDGTAYTGTCFHPDEDPTEHVIAEAELAASAVNVLPALIEWIEDLEQDLEYATRCGGSVGLDATGSSVRCSMRDDHKGNCK